MPTRPRGSRRPDHATEVVDPASTHLELIDPARLEVWQSIEPVTQADSERMKVDPDLRLVGIGSGAMDEHWFDRSPGAEVDGPMTERVIDGRRFGFCAKPDFASATQPFGPDGPQRLIVDKHHVMRFAAGRRIPILKSAEGEYFVHVVASAPDAGALAVPAGWALGGIDLEEDWVLRLPAPTTAYFFAGTCSGMESYQGPLSDLPAQWRERS